jgi:hypothetical protein
MKKYLDGEDRLVLWLADKPSWMDKLDPVEFTDEELKQIESAWQIFSDLQEKLADRFGFHRFYV